MNNTERKWYFLCKEIIPILITLGVVLEPLVDLDKISDTFLYVDVALFAVCVLIYIIGGVYFIRKHYTTLNSYVSFTKLTFIAETVLCLFGVVLAYMMKDTGQYYTLAVWYGVGLLDWVAPDRGTLQKK